MASISYPAALRNAHFVRASLMSTTRLLPTAKTSVRSFNTKSKVSVRSFSTKQGSSPPPTPPPSSSSIMWQVGTAAVVGTTFFAAYSYFGDKSWSQWSDADAQGGAKDQPVSPQADVTKHAYFDVTIDNKPVGRIVMGLHGNIVPRTVHNFATICRGTERHNNTLQLTYQNSIFHRIIPGFMIQGGDFVLNNGLGGRCVYGSVKFDDENFQLKHTGPGILSMANSGPNTNGSQFFITTARTPHLDGRHVVFGVVTDGWDVVKKVEDCGSRSGKPSGRVVIAKCGILEDDKV